jgi:hydrogenase maturation protease
LAVGNWRKRKILIHKENKVLILGIGNILMGDEGIGSHVVQYIIRNDLVHGIECMDGGTGGFYLLECIQDASVVVMIDAANDGNKTGTISCISPRYSADYPNSLTAHDIGLKDMIDAVYLLGKIPHIRLFAISIIPPTVPSLELTPEIEKLIPIIADMVLKEANQHLTSFLLSEAISGQDS